jgi:hypothetical protein
VKHSSRIKNFVLAAAAAGLLAGLPGSASGGGIGIGINIGIPVPRHDAVVVPDYDSYCVGYRHNLYDADWRLRNAQIEQWNAQEALGNSRAHEGEIAVTVEDQEAFVASFEKRVAESDAALAGARAAAGRAADDAADARARLHAFEKRIAGAKDDMDAARTLHDAAGIEDARHRIETNEAAAAAAAADLRAAEGRVADLQAAEAAAAALNDSRIRLADANAHLPALRIEMNTAHDEVFAAQQRLDAAIQGVALALHDRDEALWMLHRDEILTGRASFAACGFAIDLGVWGGHMPRDPEVVHAYFVHPVGYWVERPVEIQTRVVEVDRVVVDVGRIRVIQEKHEGPRFREVVKFETAVPVERRREFAQRVTVERTRLVAEREERTHAAAEHRPVRIPESERTEARAIVTKAHGEAHAEKIQANAEVNRAHGDAHVEKIQANAEVNKAHADAHAEKIEANAEVNKSHADAHSEKIEANAEVNKAKADAKAEQIKANADAKAKETEAKSDAKAKETEARADKQADRKTSSAAPTRGTPSRSAPGQPSADASKKNSKDPRNKPNSRTAAVDETR